MSKDRREVVEKAEICQEAGRWNDLAKLMKELVATVKELKHDERNFLSLTYKNIVGAKRASWRVVSSIEIGMDANQRRKQLTKDYRIKIEKEITESCSELLKLIERLLNNTEDAESRIFYLKMRGDYYRYLAEFTRQSKHGDVYQLAKKAYEEAMEVAKDSVSPAHPVRLGLVLNFSVFYQEILNLQGAAIDLATDANKLAEADMEHIKEESRNDSALIMELLQDNISLWTADSEDVPRRKSVR